MKRVRFRILGSFLSILATLAFAITPVAAASGKKSISLIYAQYIPSKGVVFKFDVQGKFSNLNASVTIEGQTFSLNCKKNDFGQLSCIADQGLSKYVNDIAAITVGGYYFTTTIKAAHPYYCYTVYDFYPDIPVPANWGAIGNYCQYHVAQPGQQIDYYNPNYGNSYTYEFSNDGSNSCKNSAPAFGKGYYFIC